MYKKPDNFPKSSNFLPMETCAVNTLISVSKDGT